MHIFVIIQLFGYSNVYSMILFITKIKINEISVEIVIRVFFVMNYLWMIVRNTIRLMGVRFLTFLGVR